MEKDQKKYNKARDRLLKWLNDFLNCGDYDHIIKDVKNNYKKIFAKKEGNLTVIDEEEINFTIFFDKPNSRYRPLLHIFIDKTGNFLPVKEEEIARCWCKMTYSLYQLINVKDRKYRFRDLIYDKNIYLKRIYISDDIEIGDLLLARISCVGNENQVIGFNEVFSGKMKTVLEDIIDQLVVKYREDLYNRQYEQPPLRNIFRSMTFELQAIRNLYLKDYNPNKNNKNIGDKKIFQAFYHIKDCKSITKRLQAFRYFKPSAGEYSLVWFSEKGNILYGNILIFNNLLILQTTTYQDLFRGKQLLRNLLGVRINYQHDLTKDIDEITYYPEDKYFSTEVVEKLVNTIENDEEMLLKANNDIENIIIERMRPFYTNSELRQTLVSWRQFKKMKKGNLSGKKKSWAAGIEYLMSRYYFTSVKQDVIAKKYDVSRNTVSSKYSELKSLLRSN